MISRCDSAAIVLNTSELLPEPETPVNAVSRRFGISTLTSLRLLTRAPCTRISSWLSAAGGAFLFAGFFFAFLFGALLMCEIICSTNYLFCKAIRAKIPLVPQRSAQKSAPDPDATEFAGQLFFRLWRASHTRIAERLEGIGLTPASFAVLNLIGKRGAAIQQEIGRAIGIDPSTMVALLDRLEADGLVTRRPHPDDRRAREVAITAKGRRTLERGRTLNDEVEDEVLRGLNKTERRRLLGLLRKALPKAPPQPPWSSAEGD